MPRNGAGTASLASAPFVFDTIISETPMNANFSDIINMLTASIANDGQTPILANLPMSGYRHTGVTETSGTSSRTEYVSTGTMQGGVPLDAGYTGGETTAYTATLTPAITAYADKQCFRVIFNAATGATPTINFNTVGAKKIYQNVSGTATQITTGDIPANYPAILRYDSTLDGSAGAFWIVNPPVRTIFSSTTYDEGAAPSTPSADQVVLYAKTEGLLYIKDDAGIESALGMHIPVRQTVLSGPVTSAGLPDFGGSTGSTTVTMTGTLVATAAKGFQSSGALDVIGSGTNLSWTGLSTNGTMYLYADIADGALTAGSTTLAPVYQWGGTYSTTSGQFTFNIQEMTGKVGNGSTADQTNRVFIGQVTVAGNVVTAIRWYALMGRYEGAFTATLPSTNTSISANHNIGIKDLDSYFEIECTTSEQDYAIGDRVQIQGSYSATSGIALPLIFRYNENVIALRTMSSQAITLINSSGNSFPATAANWKYRFVARRRW